MSSIDVTIRLRRPHAKQQAFIEAPESRIVIRAGRRGGKTTGIAQFAVLRFIAGRRILYATPTQEQIERFWFECKWMLAEPISAGIYYKNETRHVIELAGTEQRIRAKTAWNADTLRGDYADILIFDEWQLMNEDAWGLVGAPMLLDNNGTAVFIYTPLSPTSRSATRARDVRHAAKLFTAAQQDPRWAAFHFSSMDNPHLSRDGLSEIAQDMTPLAYRMEILAEDVDAVPGALWTPDILDQTRVAAAPAELARVIVAVDPAADVGQTGIAVVGTAFVNGRKHGYLLEDASTPYAAAPGAWAAAAVDAYQRWHADKIVGEVNNGGAMVEAVLRSIPGGRAVNYEAVRASRGKATRAEPVAALFDPPPQIDRVPRAHLVGVWPELEDELTGWVPGMPSPNRLDALVWGFTALDMAEQGWLLN